MKSVYPSVAYGVSLLSASAAAKECFYAPEIVLVQDVTWSYEEDLVMMAQHMPEVFNMLNTDFPGTKFGITTFIDDPLCGSSNVDYCARIEQSLNSPDAKDLKATRAVFERLTAGGGGDPPENFFGAIMRTLMSPQVGWSPPNMTHNEEGQPIIRLLIATTDTPSHLPGEKDVCAESKDGRKFPAQMPTSDDGAWLRDDINADCNHYDYPSGEAMMKVFEEKNVIPIFLFGRGTALTTRHQANETFKYRSYYKFANRFHYTPHNHPKFFDPHFEFGLTDLMTQYFQDQLGVEPVIATVNDEMSDFPEKLKATMTEAVERKCNEKSTTTTTSSTPTSTTTTSVTSTSTATSSSTEKKTTTTTELPTTTETPSTVSTSTVTTPGAESDPTITLVPTETSPTASETAKPFTISSVSTTSTPEETSTCSSAFTTTCSCSSSSTPCIASTTSTTQSTGGCRCCCGCCVPSHGRDVQIIVRVRD